MAHEEKQIFDAAAAIANTDERVRYLDSACGDDTQLRKRIESLLNAVVECGSFMGRRAADSFEVTRDTVNPERAGQTIGRYKLLERIGEGGFGDVYMAEQLRPVVRKVALKIIKPGMDSKQVIARFEAERQALALMEHPNIGKFLDAGATETGRPYFVMELVRGIPVSDYCEQRRLSTQERLELFMEICGAVEHAHQKGIIHRDIKPSNILVFNNGERPVPKVIDFGIAKATQGRLTDKTLFTSFHQFIGTPKYMSPEQAQMSGVDVDTRSDIYSLGVLLYELLTGKTPLDLADLQQHGYEETCRRIRDDDAPTPSKRVSTLTQAELTTLAQSQRTEPGTVASRLRGDLDWIVMKAIEKDRTRRYKTTDALASDVRRHLNNEPVSAGPPGAAYQIRKFLKRHRTVGLTALAFAGVLMLGTIISLVGWSRAAATRSDLAEQVVTTEAALSESNAARRQARVAMELAESEKIRAIKAAYLSDMQAAHQALQLKNLGMARKILQRNRHFAPELDPRHWEWRALWARCQGTAQKSFFHEKPINSLSVHRDGELVAVGGDRLCVWDISAGAIVREFNITGLAIGRFSPAGDLLYTSDESGDVHAWHVPSFEPADFLLSHEGSFDYAHEMQIAPNGEWLATFSGRRGNVSIWDVRAQKQVTETPIGKLWCPIAFSPESSKLALSGDPIRIIDVPSGDEDKLPRELSGDPVFSPDGKQIATSELVIYRRLDGERIGRLEGHSHAVVECAFSPKGKLLASASLDRTVRLWDTESHQAIAELLEHDLGVVRVAFSSDGKRLLSGGRDGQICVWNLADVGKNDWPISKSRAYNRNAWRYWPQVSCSPDGSVLAATQLQVRMGAPPGTTVKPGVTLRSTKDLGDLQTIAESSGIVRGVLFSPIENLLVISNQTGALEFFNLDDKSISEVVVFAEEKRALPVRFTPDGRFLLVIAKDEGFFEAKITGPGDRPTCGIYSMADRNFVASWIIPAEECAAISPDGQVVVTGHQDGLRFWPLDDLEGSTHVAVGGLRDGVAGPIWSVDFSPDGAYVVGGGRLTGRIEIVDVKTKQPAGHLFGHLQHIGAVRFSPDGKRLASGGHVLSDALRVWDFESRREVMSLSAEGGRSTRHVEWLQGGNSIMACNGDSQVNIWRVPSMDEIQERERLSK